METPSPKTPNVQAFQTLRTSELIKSWKQDFGIDVDSLFKGIEQLELRRDPATGRMDFLPRVLGDADFYQQLRRFSWYHPKRKLEHVHAAQLAQSGDFILDVGAGHGDFAAYLSDVDYLGLESDQVAVAAARERGRDLRAITMSELRADKTYRPADLVTAFQVLEHVDDPDTFLREMKDCMRTDGSMIVGVPDADSYVTRVPDLMLNAPPHHVTWWTEAALRKTMSRIGLDVVRVQRFAVEPWEYQLWWMAKFSRWMGDANGQYFGRNLRARKVAAFSLSWPLQWVAPPKSASGSTLLVHARRTDD
ncbi:MAG: class I SAM-dependent methyltransferase [Pseudomonadota bacterium]